MSIGLHMYDEGGENDATAVFEATREYMDSTTVATAIVPTGEKLNGFGISSGFVKSINEIKELVTKRTGIILNFVTMPAIGFFDDNPGRSCIMITCRHT